MKKLIDEIEIDENGALSPTYASQQNMFEKTLEFLKMFDKSVAISFLRLNPSIEKSLGSFYGKLLEELEK